MFCHHCAQGNYTHLPPGWYTTGLLVMKTGHFGVSSLFLGTRDRLHKNVRYGHIRYDRHIIGNILLRARHSLSPIHLQHLWSSRQNRFQGKVGFQTFHRTTSILIGPAVLVWLDQICVERRARECPALAFHCVLKVRRSPDIY
ncbi:hypothetical protein AVEN_124605-1 [Araneus ventricosus]|uniref:Uncharacterized protein n=1 Tax=Araneus ventricosus TaxID=182803 RepID=A0A4Y2KW25_ARAVE|nr:hypothetical protein AVEN_124605-1 [Araneus ventricosus]